MVSSPVPFEALSSADLTVGRVYRGGPQKDIGADPLHPLTGVGNAGGFRRKNVKGSTRAALCVLYSTGQVSEWPDGWDSEGSYTYFGDQRRVGLDVLDTPRGGNRLLADVAAAMRTPGGRSAVPPFLLFEKDGDRGRDVRFEGVLVPTGEQWLTVEHRDTGDGRLCNYRAQLTRLPIEVVTRHWLNQLLDGTTQGAAAPNPWKRWVSAA